MKHGAFRNGLIAALVGVACLAARADETKRWDFDDADNYTVSDDTKIKVNEAAGRAELILQSDTYHYTSIDDYLTGDANEDLTAGSDVGLRLSGSPGNYALQGTFTSRLLDRRLPGVWQRIEADVDNTTITKNNLLGEMSGDETGIMALFHFNNNFDNEGPNYGAIPSASTPTFTSDAKFGSHSVQFSGNNFVTVRDPEMLHGASSVSFSFWLKLHAHQAYAGIVFARGSYGQGLNLNSGGNRIELRVYTTSGLSLATTTTELSLNQWYFIAGTWSSGSSARIYVNGTLEDQGSSLSGTFHQNDYFKIPFDDYDSFRKVSCTIDECAIWRNRQLTATQIRNMYRNFGALKFQVRSADTNVLSGDFVGPDGTADTYYTGEGEDLESGGNFDVYHQYAQYKISLFSDAYGDETPQIGNVSLLSSVGTRFDSVFGDFDAGTASSVSTLPATLDTPFLGLAKKANGGYPFNGTYTSRTLDGGAGTAWTAIEWGMQDEISSSTDGLLGLYHMEGSWAPEVGSIFGTATDDDFTTTAKLGAQSAVFNGTSSEVVFDVDDDVQALEFWINDENFNDGILSILNSASETVTLTLTNRRAEVGGTAGTVGVVYVNGKPGAAKLLSGWNHVAVNFASAVSVNTLTLGQVSGDFLDGVLDELALYDRELTTTEIMAHYVAGGRSAAGRVRARIRTGNTLPLTGDFTGPGGYTYAYYQNGASLSLFDKQYLQYRLFFEGDGNATPGVRSVTLTTSAGDLEDDTRSEFLQGSFDGDETTWYGDAMKLLDLSAPGPTGIDAAGDPGVEGVWHMEESSWSGGASVLDAVGSRHGTAGGGARTASTDPGVGSRYGYFGSYGAFVVFPSISLPDDFTVSFWFRTWVHITDRCAVMSSDDAGKGYTLELNSNGTSEDVGRVAFIVSDGSSTYAVASGRGGLNDNRWHNVTAVRSGTQIHLYIDGYRESTGYIGSGFGSVGDGSAYVAAHPDHAEFVGSVDDLGIWSRALSEAEMLKFVALGYDTEGEGVFTSETLDAGRASIWEKIVWAADGPYGKPISADEEGVAAVWHLDETSGSATVTDSAVGLIGTLNGNASLGADGKFFTALELDGSGDYVSIPHDQALEAGEVTVEAWVKMDQVNSRTVFDKSDGAGLGYVLGTDAEGYPYFRVDASVCIGVLPVRSGKWTHLAGSYDGTSLKVYLDGELSGILESAGLLTASSRPALLGRRADGGGQDFDGMLDEVLVSDGALLLEEVFDHYRAGAATLKFQARTATNGVFAGQAFVGPGGSTNTYYTDFTGSDMIGDIGLSQHFQFKMYTSTEDARISPRMHGVTVFSASYPGDTPTVEPTEADGFAFLGYILSFDHERTFNANTDIRYQISGDSGTSNRWFYWDTSDEAWTEVNITNGPNEYLFQTSDRDDINAHVTSFYDEIYDKVGGLLRFKAFLYSAGDQQMAVDWVEVEASEGRIVVESPNGEEEGDKAWVVGVPYDITWSSAGNVSENIVIELFDASGSNFVKQLGANLPNTGLYRTIISNDKGDDYRIRIRDGNDSTIFDWSDSDFELVDNLHLTAPDGGERWYIGITNTVTWDAPGPYPEQHVGSPLALWFSGDLGANWVLVAEPTNWPGNNAFGWLTPSNDSRLVSETAQMAISTPTLDPASPLTYRVDFSDEIFTNAGIVVTYPAEGTAIKMGNIIDIEWVAAGAGTNQGVSIRFWNGTMWSNLASAATCVPGSNSFTAALVSENPTESALIEIQANEHPEVLGISYPFVLADVNILTPKGGTPYARDQWQIGTTNVISWTAGGGGDTVDIEYTIDGGTNWYPIALDYVNSNSVGSTIITNYSPPWIVSGPPSAEAQVRVRSVEQPDLYDITDYFDIAGVQVSSPNGQEVWKFTGTNYIYWLHQGAGANAALDIAYVNAPTDDDYETLYDNLSIFAGFKSVPPGTVRRPSNFGKIRIRSLTFDSMVDVSDDYFTIQGISLTHPTNEAVYTMGTTVTNGLQWFSAATEATTARLYYSPDGETYDDVIQFGPNSFIGNIDGGAGYNRQNWTVSRSHLPSESARVKIVAGKYSAISEEFTLRGIRITRPASGDMLDVGGYEALNWVPAGLSSGARADFDVSTEGLNGAYTNAGLPTFVFVPGRSSFWSVDPEIDPSTNAVVRMSITSPESDTDIVMYSDPFTLRGLKLLSPGSTNTWMLGTTKMITFLAAGMGDDADATFYYSADGGATYDEENPIAEGHPVTDGFNSLIWDIESAVALTRRPSTNAVIKVVVGEYEDTTEPFVMEGIKVTQPNGAQIWAVSDVTNYIRWAEVGYPGPYNLSFSLWENDSVVYTETIDTGVSGTEYEWIMTSNAIGSNVTITVSDPAPPAGGFTGESEMFEIVARPSIRITSPGSGAFWKVGETNTIRWTLGGNMSNDFYLAYSYYPYEQTNLLGSGAFTLEDNECRYQWSPIPNRLGPARIICVNQVDETIADTADDWRIAPKFRISPFVGDVFALEPTSIDWFTLGSVSGVDLFYSTDPNRGLTNWVKINTEGTFTGVAHDQPSAYQWTVPNVLTRSMWLRIQDHDYAGQVFSANEPGPYDDYGMFTVKYYTIVWRVFDVDTTNELNNLSVSDTVGWSESDLASPVTNFYPYGTWDTVWFREYFHDKVVLGWDSQPSRQIQVWMERSEIEPEYHVMADFTYSYSKTNFTIQSWLERGGSILETPDACRIRVYDSGGDLVETLETTESDDGVFWQTWNVLDSLADADSGDVFFAKVEIEYSGVTYSSGLTFTLLQAASASVETVIDTIETSTDSIRDDIDTVASGVSNLTSMTSTTMTNVQSLVTSMTNQVLPNLSTLTNEIGVISSITNLADAVDIIGQELPEVLARILTRMETMTQGSTNSVMYKTRKGYGDSVVTLTVSNAVDGLVEQTDMSEILTGIYYADVVADWDLGRYTVTCSDPSAHDSMSVRVVEGDIYELPQALKSLTDLDKVASSVSNLVEQFSSLDTNVFDLADVMGELSTNVDRMVTLIQETDLGYIGTNVERMADSLLGVDMTQMAGDMSNMYAMVSGADFDRMSRDLTNVLSSVTNMAGLVGTDLSSMAGNVTSVLWRVENMAGDVTNTLAAVQSLTGIDEIVGQLSGLSNTVQSLSGVTNLATDINNLTNALAGVNWSDVEAIQQDVTQLTNMVSGISGLEAMAEQIGSLSNAFASISSVTNMSSQLQDLADALAGGDLTDISDSVNTLTNSLAGADFTQISADVANITEAVQGAYLSNVWNQVQGEFFNQIAAGITNIEQVLGDSSDTSGQNTFFGRLAGMSSQLTTIGSDANTAVLRAQGAKRSADAAASGIDDVKSEMAKGNLEGAVQILRNVKTNLAEAQDQIREIPKGVEVTRVYERMQTMAQQMDRFAESKGFKGLLNYDFTAAEGGPGGPGGEGPDEQTVGALNQTMQEVKARMEFVEQLLDESQREPVIKEDLLGVEE